MKEDFFSLRILHEKQLTAAILLLVCKDTRFSVSPFLPTGNVPVKSKLQHPPGQTPGHLNFWKVFGKFLEIFFARGRGC